MSLTQNIKFAFNLSTWISLAVLITGCSIFGRGSSLSDPGFRQRMTPAQQAVPLPVEIAKDIERISEDGLLVYSDNPSYSKAFGDFAKGMGNSDQFSVLNELDGTIAGEATDKEDSESKIVSDSSNNSNELALDEDKLFVKKDGGPLAQSLKRNRTGPLNFKAALGNSTLPALTGGKTVSYVVRLGDTLMKIAFEKYANYLRWKDIYRVNSDKMKSPERMQVGTELTIKNVKYIYIKRDGKPYLIKKMDTLKSISQSLYGTPNRWRDIWENNPQLIRNPKKIYSGFTLYYPTEKKVDEIERRAPTSNSKTASGKLPKRLPKK